MRSVLPYSVRFESAKKKRAQELQRMKGKCDEALSEVGTFRSESERLSATVETLRAAATVATVDDSGKPVPRAGDSGEEEATAGTEARQEIKRLRNIIDDLELERKVSSPGGGTGGGSGTDDNDCGEAQGHRNRVGDADGEAQDAGGEEGKTLKATKGVVEERNRLRAELQQAREDAAVRTAGLETQLADKEVRLALSSFPRVFLGAQTLVFGFIIRVKRILGSED